LPTTSIIMITLAPGLTPSLATGGSPKGTLAKTFKEAQDTQAGKSTSRLGRSDRDAA
jgi:hypothetical protein